MLNLAETLQKLGCKFYFLSNGAATEEQAERTGGRLLEKWRFVDINLFFVILICLLPSVLR